MFSKREYVQLFYCLVFNECEESIDLLYFIFHVYVLWCSLSNYLELYECEDDHLLKIIVFKCENIRFLQCVVFNEYEGVILDECEVVHLSKCIVLYESEVVNLFQCI